MNFRIVLKHLFATAALAGLSACGGGDGAPLAFTVGGTVAGSAGSIVLQINGGGNLTLATPGGFIFSSGLASGTAYSVTVNSAQNCTVTNGTGTVGATNITSITITCTTVVRSASLSGAQESPPTASTATGRGAVIVNPTTLEITGGITFAGLTPTGFHIHQAPTGNPSANGPVITTLVLAPGGGVATVPAGSVLTAPQYAALVAGELYFNVHTAVNSAGEIRGQINVRGGVTAGLATLNASQEVPTNVSTAVGRGTLVFDSATRNILIAYATHNVVGATAAHIHTGALGVNGPANVATLSADTSVYTAPNPSALTVQNATDIGAGNTYFNVHSATYGGGEIRGQIAIQ